MLGRIHLNLSLLVMSLMMVSPGWSQAPDLESRLNDRLYKDTVTETARSAKALFTAYLQLSEPPIPAGADFNLTTIWPGMPEWDAVSNWAASNEQMGEAIISSEKKILLGMPYGQNSVDRDWRMNGVMIDVAPGGDLSVINFPYLHGAAETIACWTTAEFYRLLEAGEYEKSFKLGLAFLRVLRQGCEQEMLEEKVWFMNTLSDALSTQRDAMYSYLDKIPPALFKQLGMKEYPFLKPTDDERMKRLEMPEGDRIVAEAMISKTFDAGGQPIPEQFADVFGALQARDSPLTRFGSKKRWSRLSSVHASRDASNEKLIAVYDDWWRRWRMRQYDSSMDIPTEFSRLNEIRFAAIVEMVNDLDDAFLARERLVANINGTIISAGLCGYHQTYKEWPKTLAPVYAVFAIKRFDFDPYNKDYSSFIYRQLSSRRAIDSDYGQVWVDGCMLYSLGKNHSDDQGKTSSVESETGDLLLWPPTRQLARNEGLLD
jgi:hypothetical protein